MPAIVEPGDLLLVLFASDGGSTVTDPDGGTASARMFDHSLHDWAEPGNGAGPEVVRLSVGLESLDDILADLDLALKTATASLSSAAE